MKQNQIVSIFKNKVELKISALFLLVAGLSACSMDVAIYKSVFQPSADTLIEENTNRTSPDFVSGEAVVTTEGTPGYQVLGAFGEVSEEVVSLNGNNWKIEGVFYH